MKKLILLVCFLLMGCVSTWTAQDYALQTTYTALHVADWAQTLRIARNPDRYYETNPSLGLHPSEGRVNGYMASTLILHWVVTDLIPDPPIRTGWQFATIGLEAEVVHHNHTRGIKLSLAF